MKISFTDFWMYPKPFDPNNNFLTHLIKSSKEDIDIVSPDKADIIIYSNFGIEHKKYNCKKIFFTGENKRPNFNECDFSISFDFDDYNDRNIRIPLWYYYIDWFKVGSYGNPDYLIPERYLYEPNEFSMKEKNKFCSSVYSNPVGVRNDFVNELSKYKKVDCYGKVNGFNHLPYGEKLKMDVISNYKFNICFENSLYSGYYTEKLLHAKISGCIPIYYSDNNMCEDFNQKCCINLNNFTNKTELIKYIKEVDNDNDIYSSLFNEPLFNEKINLELIYEKISHII